ncbi:MAG: hypothetical protein LC659_06390 [Myxococcales bacterium]|nr:hypothetical protein [Myxococcales bacterium]
MRRALALGYAAIDSPTVTKISEAERFVFKVLGAIDDNLCGGEIAELVKALRTVAAELSGLQQRTA